MYNFSCRGDAVIQHKEYLGWPSSTTEFLHLSHLSRWPSRMTKRNRTPNQGTHFLSGGPAWSRLVVTLFGATTWTAFHCFEKRSHFKKAIHVASNVVDISAIIEDAEILAQFGTWNTLNWCHLTLRTFEKCVQRLVLIPGRHLIWKHLRSSFNGHENHDHNMEQS